MRHDDDKDPAEQALAAVAGLARTVETHERDLASKGADLADIQQRLPYLASRTEVQQIDQAVAKIAVTVEGWEQLLTRLTKTRTRSTKQPTDLKEAGTDAAPVRSWLRLPEGDHAAVEAVLSELLPWMQSVYLRYAPARDSLPACWLWHPEIVEELLWLMDAWTAAYEGDEASNKLVGDWHDRQRPGVTRRIGEYAPACDVLAHRDDANQPAVTVPLAAEADPIVAWWATARDHNGPEPTTEQIQAGRRGLKAVPNTSVGGQR